MGHREGSRGPWHRAEVLGGGPAADAASPPPPLRCFGSFHAASWGSPAIWGTGGGWAAEQVGSAPAGARRGPTAWGRLAGELGVCSPKSGILSPAELDGPCPVSIARQGRVLDSSPRAELSCIPLQSPPPPCAQSPLPAPPKLMNGGWLPGAWVPMAVLAPWFIMVESCSSEASKGPGS